MKHFTIFFISLTLLGCSSGINLYVPDSIANTDAKIGYLAGTLGVTTEWPSTGEGIITTLSIRPVGQSESMTLTTTQPRNTDFSSDTEKGQVFVTALPVGQYEINQVHFKGSNGRQTVRSKSNDNLAIFFNISADQVTYIGQFITSSLVANSQFWNTPYPSGFGIIHHRYDVKRDKPLMTERFPEIKALSFDQVQLEGYKPSKLASKLIEK